MQRAERVALALQAQRGRSVRGFPLAQHWPALAVFLAIGLGWEAGVRWTRTPAYLIPAPSAILARAAGDLPYFLGEAAVTFAEAMAGLALASVVALSAAVLMSHARWAERALFPLAVAVKVTPVVAIAPLLVLWLGFGPAPKIVVAALISYFPILSNAMTGFRSVNPRALEFLRSLAASPAEVFWKLRLPHALPYLFSAYKVSATLSVVGAFVAEWVGADRGLGHVIILANSNLDMTTLAAAVLVLAIIGIALYLLVDALERHWLFWHESILSTKEGE
ncbi:MAG: ABC transporter permease [Chloroflexi bacterium]|nr:ABC transporter permease [Chloroflexota bacterium]